GGRQVVRDLRERLRITASAQDRTCGAELLDGSGNEDPGTPPWRPSPRCRIPPRGGGLGYVVATLPLGAHRRSTLDGVTSDSASGLIARLKAAVERAE